MCSGGRLGVWGGDGMVGNLSNKRRGDLQSDTGKVEYWGSHLHGVGRGSKRLRKGKASFDKRKASCEPILLKPPQLGRKDRELVTEVRGRGECC